MRILRTPDGQTDEPLLQRSLILDEPIVDFLLDTGSVNLAMAACIQVVPAGRMLGDLRWSGDLKRQLFALLRQSPLDQNTQSSDQLSVHFHGPKGTGKRTLAASLCREVGIPLLCIDLTEVVARFDNFEAGLRTLFRQGILSESALFLDNIDCLAAEEERNASRRKSVCRVLDELSWLCFLGTSESWAFRDMLPSRHCVSLELPTPNLSERRELWSSLAVECTSANLQFNSDVDWPAVAVKFRMTPGERQLRWTRLSASHVYAILRTSLSARKICIAGFMRNPMPSSTPWRAS